MTKYSDLLAIPLQIIYSQVYSTLEWPKLWSNETVHLIQKNTSPDSLKQLRNLSCTPLFSKVLESFILTSLKSSTKLSPRQFGGQKGSGVNHFLVEAWNIILTSPEDSRASVQAMAIDFEKAFNRMDHDCCLNALTSLGASAEDVELVACFLRNRHMQVKIGDIYSEPKSVPGGSPQGSILGNFLFCTCTDEFTTKKMTTPVDTDNNIGENAVDVGVNEDASDNLSPEDSDEAESFDSDYELSLIHI